ncbi:MAG: transcriptional regulator, AraC family [Paenibacillus sp.]|jgi:AraC-like DNA-binding protein|nr:transcriptional regulator, AraC family [Paenibacillus sp.]
MGHGFAFGKTYRSSYLVRLLLLSVCLGLSPVILLGAFAYWKSADIAKHKMIEGTANALLQNEMRLEQLLKTVDNAATQFSTSPIVYDARDNQLVYSQFQIVDSLLVGMHTLQTFDNGIQDVTFVHLKNDWLINNRLMKPLSQLGDAAQQILHLPMLQTSQWIKEAENHPLVPGTSWNNGVNLVKKIPINSVDPWGLLITQIPGYELLKYLVPSSRSERILILDESHRVIVDNNPSGIPTERTADYFAPALKQLQSMQAGSGFFAIDLQGIPIGITFQKSDYNAWTYLSFIPIHEMTKDSRVIGWLTLFICMGLVVLILVISFRASRGMYAPIRKLFDSAAQSDELPMEIASSKDELQYIGERLNRFQHTQMQLEVERVRYMQQVKELYVLHLCQGKLKHHDPEEENRLFEAFRCRDELYVLSMGPYDETLHREQDRQLLLFAVTNMVSELVSPDRRLTPIVIDHFQICVIGCDRALTDNTRSELLQLTEHLQSTIKEVLKLKVSIGISRPYGRLEDTAKAYGESLEALQYTLMIGQESVLFIDDVRPQGQHQPAYPDQIESELIDAVKLGMADTAIDLLSQFMNEITKPPVEIRTYQLSLLRLFTDLIRLMESQTDADVEAKIDAKASLDQIFELKTKKETELWFQSLLLSIIRMFEMDREHQFKNISEQVLAIIHDNFHTELTLEVCSRRLNYHANYLKRVFRSETGTNFSDYLIQYRMTMAKKWLIETDLKISEIAGMVGYKIPQNFIRIFRKAEAITPGQYRERYIQSHPYRND